MHTLALPINNPSFFPYKGAMTAVNLSKPERQIQNNVEHVMSVMQFITGQSPLWSKDVTYINGVQIVEHKSKFWLAQADNLNSEPTLVNTDWKHIELSDIRAIVREDYVADIDARLKALTDKDVYYLSLINDLTLQIKTLQDIVLSGGGGSGGTTLIKSLYSVNVTSNIAVGSNYTVPSENNFLVGVGALDIYLDGQRLAEGIDYTEVDNKTVKFNIAVPANSTLKFLVYADSIISRRKVYGIPVTSDITAGTNIALPLSDTYSLGNNSLWVFLDGTLMQLGLDYREVDNTCIEFLSDIKKGQSLVLISHTAMTQSRRVLSTDLPDGAYTLPNGKSFLAGNYLIDVFVDGVRQTERVDYVESSSTEITFSYKLFAGQEVAIIIAV